MNTEEMERFRRRINSPQLVQSETLRNNFNFLLDEIEKLQKANEQHIKVVTDYAIENQQLKQQIQGFEKINYKQATKIIHYKNTIKQTIQHLENFSSHEESMEEIHQGMVSWLNDALEGGLNT